MALKRFGKRFHRKFADHSFIPISRSFRDASFLQWTLLQIGLGTASGNGDDVANLLYCDAHVRLFGGA